MSQKWPTTSPRQEATTSLKSYLIVGLTESKKVVHGTSTRPLGRVNCFDKYPSIPSIQVCSCILPLPYFTPYLFACVIVRYCYVARYEYWHVTVFNNTSNINRQYIQIAVLSFSVGRSASIRVRRTRAGPAAHPLEFEISR